MEEIRCQFVILARKDVPTPDYARAGATSMAGCGLALNLSKQEVFLPRNWPRWAFMPIQPQTAFSEESGFLRVKPFQWM